MTCNSATRVVQFSSTCMLIEETRVCLTFFAARKEFSRSEEKLSAQQGKRFCAARIFLSCYTDFLAYELWNFPIYELWDFPIHMLRDLLE